MRKARNGGNEVTPNFLASCLFFPLHTAVILASWSRYTTFSGGTFLGSFTIQTLEMGKRGTPVLPSETL